MYGGKTILEHLMENGFEHLNISKAHYEDQRNIELMKYTKIEMNNVFLSEIQNFFGFLNRYKRIF